MGNVYSCDMCQRKATLRYQLYVHCSIDEDVPEHLLPWCEIRFFHEDGKGTNSILFRCDHHPLVVASLPAEIQLTDCRVNAEGFVHM